MTELFPDAYPICLPDPAQDYNNVTALVIGWGLDKDVNKEGKLQKILQKANVITSHCNASQYEDNLITDSMMCAADEANGRDACQGDSGGPLAVLGPDRNYVQIGIVSWGFDCNSPGFPGIYTSVTRLLPWIKKTIKTSG